MPGMIQTNIIIFVRTITIRKSIVMRIVGIQYIVSKNLGIQYIDSMQYIQVIRLLYNELYNELYNDLYMETEEKRGIIA